MLQDTAGPLNSWARGNALPRGHGDSVEVFGWGESPEEEWGQRRGPPLHQREERGEEMKASLAP